MASDAVAKATSRQQHAPPRVSQQLALLLAACVFGAVLGACIWLGYAGVLFAVTPVHVPGARGGDDRYDVVDTHSVLVPATDVLHGLAAPEVTALAALPGHAHVAALALVHGQVLCVDVQAGLDTLRACGHVPGHAGQVLALLADPDLGAVWALTQTGGVYRSEPGPDALPVDAAWTHVADAPACAIGMTLHPRLYAVLDAAAEAGQRCVWGSTLLAGVDGAVLGPGGALWHGHAPHALAVSAQHVLWPQLELRTLWRWARDGEQHAPPPQPVLQHLPCYPSDVATDPHAAGVVWIACLAPRTRVTHAVLTSRFWRAMLLPTAGFLRHAAPAPGLLVQAYVPEPGGGGGAARVLRVLRVPDEAGHAFTRVAVTREHVLLVSASSGRVVAVSRTE